MEEHEANKAKFFTPAFLKLGTDAERAQMETAKAQKAAQERKLLSGSPGQQLSQMAEPAPDWLFNSCVANQEPDWLTDSILDIDYNSKSFRLRTRPPWSWSETAWNLPMRIAR